MDKMINAYVLYGKEDLRYEQQPMPEVKDDHVLVKVRRVGICGSDVHYFMDGRCGASVPKRPFVFGHEFIGKVAKVGANVDSLAVGTRVAVDPSQPCGMCSFCRSGRYNLCRKMEFIGSAKFDPPAHGAYREYIAVPAINCYPLPDTLDDGKAAMLEPLSVAIHAVMRSGSVAGKTVLITGGGTIGQMVLQVARAYGAETITLSDVAEFPRQFALEMGADSTLNPLSKTIVDDAMNIAEGGFDVVFEASGAPAAAQQAIDLVNYGGTIVQIGTLPVKNELTFNMIMEKELQLIGTFRFANVFPTALKLAASGRINLQTMISKVFPFTQLPEALRTAHRKENIVKVQVEM